MQVRKHFYTDNIPLFFSTLSRFPVLHKQHADAETGQNKCFRIVIAFRLIMYFSLMIRLLFYVIALVVTGNVSFNLVSKYTITFYAGAMVLLFLCFLALTGVELFKIFFPKKETGNSTLLILSVFIALLSVEGFLRLLMVNATYNEIIDHPYYNSQYSVNKNNFWYLYEPHDTLDYPRKDFDYFRLTNSLGIPEREIDLTDTTPVRKILSLGDSFTEGIGATEDSTWSRLLEKYLNKKSADSFLVYNGGIAGSDPVFGYHLMKGPLWNTEWEAVIFCINTTDIVDCNVRGGLERFREDSTIVYKQPPAWEPLYASSFLFRFIINHIMGYDHFFFTYHESRKHDAQSVIIIESIFRKAKEELSHHGIEMLVVVHPLEWEIEQQAFSNDYMDTLLYRIEDLQPINLLPYYIDSLEGKTTVKKLYWTYDAHFNPEGYRLMAEKISREYAERFFEIDNE